MAKVNLEIIAKASEELREDIFDLSVLYGDEDFVEFLRDIERKIPKIPEDLIAKEHHEHQQRFSSWLCSHEYTSRVFNYATAIRECLRDYEAAGSLVSEYYLNLSRDNFVAIEI